MQLPSFIKWVTRPEADVSYLFPAYRNISKVIVLNWLSSLLSDTVSRQHGEQPPKQPTQVYPVVYPVMRRRNGKRRGVCLLFGVWDCECPVLLRKPLGACPAGSRVWMTTVQSGRLVMGNQTKPCTKAGGNNNRALLAIDCFYCNCFLPAFMALFGYVWKWGIPPIIAI